MSKWEQKDIFTETDLPPATFIEDEDGSRIQRTKLERIEPKHWRCYEKVMSAEEVDTMINSVSANDISNTFLQSNIETIMEAIADIYKKLEELKTEN